MVVVCFILLLGASSQVKAQDTKLKWFGHAAFSITTPNGKVLLIDPWLNNPLNPEAKDANTEAIRRFNDHVAGDRRVDSVMLPISDGLTFARKK